MADVSANTTSTAIIEAEVDEVWDQLRRVDLSLLFPQEVAWSETCSTVPAASVGSLSLGCGHTPTSRLKIRITASQGRRGVVGYPRRLAWRVVASREDAAASWGAFPRSRKDSVTLRSVTCTTSASSSSKKPSKTLIEWRTSLPPASMASAGNWLRSQQMRGVNALRHVLGCGPGTVVRMFGDAADGSSKSVYDAWRESAPANTAALCRDGESETSSEQTAMVLNVATNLFEPRPWNSLRPGDFVRVKSGEFFPADMLLLWSSCALQTAISMKKFDGVNNLRRREPVDSGVLSRATVPVSDQDGGAPSTDTMTSDAELAAALAASASLSGVCSICTTYNMHGAETCSFCGSPLAPAASTPTALSAKPPVELLGQGDFASEEDIDIPTVLQALRDCATIELPSPRVDGKFKAVFRPCDGTGVTTTDHKQLLPRWSQLVFTEAVVGMVVFTGSNTLWALRGGSLGAARSTIVEKQDKANKEFLKSTAEARRAAQLAEPVDPFLLEKATGIKWEDHFTNVPDDGNCGMHAFWLGLRALLRYYPHLRLEDEPALADSAAAFRTQALNRLEADASYMSLVDSMLRLWLSLDSVVLASSVEDFFTLPAPFQAKVMAMNKQAHATGTDGLDVAALCRDYVHVMREAHATGEGDRVTITYVPLGEIELSALCKLYHVRLQAIKSEDIIAQSGKPKAGAKKPTIEEQMAKVDPRCIRPEFILDRFAPRNAKRIIRVCNVNTNHYQVHLPMDPAA